jgi:hypothetical protein
MTTDFVESEMQEPETPFEPRKYRVTYSCQLCGHQWKSRWLKAVPKKDPPCPNPSCVEVSRLRQEHGENQRLRAMLEAGQGPAHIGGNTMVNAVDATANIVMQDYGLTNLKDGIRPGESMAPKLPPQQQAMADSMFGGGKGDVQVTDAMTGQKRTVQSATMNRLGQRAIAGAFRGMSVAPNSVIPEAMRGQPPLRVVRRETIHKA